VAASAVREPPLARSDRVDADPEPLGRRLVVEPFVRQGHDPRVARRYPVARGPRLDAALIEVEIDDLREADSADERLQVDRSLAAVLDAVRLRGLRERDVVASGQDQDPRPRLRRAYLAQDLHARSVGQEHVENEAFEVRPAQGFPRLRDAPAPQDEAPEAIQAAHRGLREIDVVLEEQDGNPPVPRPLPHRSPPLAPVAQGSGEAAHRSTLNARSSHRECARFAAGPGATGRP